MRGQTPMPFRVIWGEYGPLKHLLVFSELCFELGLLCCLFTERHTSKEHYDIQNIWLYPALLDIKSTICTWWVDHIIPNFWDNIVYLNRRISLQLACHHMNK